MNGQSCAAVRLLLLDGGGASMRVTGASMGPLYPEGGSVGVRPFHGRPVPGRCYIFIDRDALFLHRCLSVQADTALFIGDRCNAAQRVDRCCVIGEPAVRFSGVERPIHLLNLAFGGLLRHGWARAARSRLISAVYLCSVGR